MKSFGFRCGYMAGNRSRFSKYYMTGSPVFSINFTNQSIKNSQAILKCFIDLKSSVWFTLVSDFRSIRNLLKITDCRPFSILKTVTGYRSYSHSVQFFRPVKTIVRNDEANSMAFLQREFLPSNDTYKTKTSAGNTLNFIRGNENVTHSAQGETVFWGGNFLFRISEYTQRERKCSFRKLQIFISQTTDFHFANYRFPFRFVPFRFVPFRFVPFRFANYSKPYGTC